MGFIDQGLNAISGGSSASAPTDANAVHPGLVDNVLGMIGNQGAGGLGGLLEKFKSAGLGQAADSWVGTGQNQPISPDQVQSAIGSTQIADWSQKLGIPVDQLKAQLAHVVPSLVDKLTPTGQVPENHGLLQSAVGLLKGKLLA